MGLARQKIDLTGYNCSFTAKTLGYLPEEFERQGIYAVPKTELERFISDVREREYVIGTAIKETIPYRLRKGVVANCSLAGQSDSLIALVEDYLMLNWERWEQKGRILNMGLALDSLCHDGLVLEGRYNILAK